VKIIIATDYYCDDVVMFKLLPTSCATSSTCIPLMTYGNNMYNKSLAHVFYGQDLSLLKAGGYYICISAVQYDSISSPSLPAYLYLLANQSGVAY